MQISRSTIEYWLMWYDRRKPFWRHLFEHNAIKSLKTELRTHPRAGDFDYDDLIAFFTTDPATPYSMEDDMRYLIEQENTLLWQRAVAQQEQAPQEQEQEQEQATSPWLTEAELKERGLWLSEEEAQEAELILRPSQQTLAHVQSTNPFILMPAPVLSAPSAPQAPAQTYADFLDSIPYDGVIPPEFACALETSSIMTRPVYLKWNPNFICERSTLVSWCHAPDGGTCPTTRKAFTEADIVDHTVLQGRIDVFIANTEECYGVKFGNSLQNAF